MKAFRLILSLLPAVLCLGCSHKPLDLPDPDGGEAAVFSIHAEISTDRMAECAVLSLCLTEGDKTCTYTGKIFIDGEPMNAAGIRINFSETPIHTVSLPSSLLPGEHSVRVEINAREHTEILGLSFREPIRHKEIWVRIGHDDKSGCTYLSVDDNPYGLQFTVTDHIVVEGECSYEHCIWPGFTATAVETMTIEDEKYLPAFVPKAGVQYELVNRESKENEMTSFGIDSYGWRQVWNNAGEGYWDWEECYTGRSFYEVTSALQHIDVTIVGVSGITVRVFCTETEVVFNGVLMGTESHSYTI